MPFIGSSHRPTAHLLDLWSLDSQWWERQQTKMLERKLRNRKLSWFGEELWSLRPHLPTGRARQARTLDLSLSSESGTSADSLGRGRTRCRRLYGLTDERSQAEPTRPRDRIRDCVDNH